MPAADHSVWDVMMFHTLYVYTMTGRGGDGRPVYSTAFKSYRAYVDMNQSVTRDASGEKRDVSATCYVNTNGDTLRVADKVVLPDFNNQERPIVRLVNNVDALDGAIHTVTVYLG